MLVRETIRSALVTPTKTSRHVTRRPSVDPSWLLVGSYRAQNRHKMDGPKQGSIWAPHGSNSLSGLRCQRASLAAMQLIVGLGWAKVETNIDPSWVHFMPKMCPINSMGAYKCAPTTPSENNVCLVLSEGPQASASGPNWAQVGFKNGLKSIVIWAPHGLQDGFCCHLKVSVGALGPSS